MPGPSPGRPHRPGDAACFVGAQGGHVRIMANTYRVTEIVGTSPEGVDAAIRSGISDASKTLRNLDWAQVSDIRLHLEEGSVEHFQVTLKVGFKVEE